MRKEEFIGRLELILLRLPGTPERIAEVMRFCRQGHQQCHNCPVWDCGDNLIKTDIKRLIREYDSENGPAYP